MDLAGHSGFTNWRGCTPNWITTNQIKFVGFWWQAKPSQRIVENQQTEPMYDMTSTTEPNPRHIGGIKLTALATAPVLLYDHKMDFYCCRISMSTAMSKAIVSILRKLSQSEDSTSLTDISLILKKCLSPRRTCADGIWGLIRCFSLMKVWYLWFSASGTQLFKSS